MLWCWKPPCSWVIPVRIHPVSLSPAQTICFVRYAGKIVQIAEHTSFASFVLQGVEARATELGYSTQVRYLNAGDMYNPQTLEFIRNADGIIFLGTDITATQLPEIEQLFGYLGAARPWSWWTAACWQTGRTV